MGIYRAPVVNFSCTLGVFKRSNKGDKARFFNLLNKAGYKGDFDKEWSRYCDESKAAAKKK